MKKGNISNYFPKSTKIQIKKANHQEIREGWLIFNKEKWPIKDGILINPHLPEYAKKEKKAVKVLDNIPELGGGIKLAREEIIKALKKLPEGDGKSPFNQRGAFLNISLGANDYHKFILSLNKKEHILEIGADSCWSLFNLAKKGHLVWGIDINDHIFLRKIYLNEVFFECTQADMHSLPFKNNIFDIVFASAAIHHSQDLEKLFKEFFRVLKPYGRIVFLKEPVRGVFSQKEFGKKQIKFGVSENVYTPNQWKMALKKAGFQNIQIKPANLDLDKIKRLEFKDRFWFLLKYFKKILLINLSFLGQFTISDYNILGKKPKIRYN